MGLYVCVSIQVDNDLLESVFSFHCVLCRSQALNSVYQAKCLYWLSHLSDPSLQFYSKTNMKQKGQGACPNRPSHTLRHATPLAEWWQYLEPSNYHHPPTPSSTPLSFGSLLALLVKHTNPEDICWVPFSCSSHFASCQSTLTQASQQTTQPGNVGPVLKGLFHRNKIWIMECVSNL